MMEASTAHHRMEREPNENSSRLRLRRPAHNPSATMPTKYASKTTVSMASRASMTILGDRISETRKADRAFRRRPEKGCGARLGGDDGSEHGPPSDGARA